MMKQLSAVLGRLVSLAAQRGDRGLEVPRANQGQIPFAPVHVRYLGR